MRTISRIPSAILLVGAAAVASILPHTLEGSGERATGLAAPLPAARSDVLAPLYPAPEGRRPRLGGAGDAQPSVEATTAAASRTRVLGAGSRLQQQSRLADLGSAPMSRGSASTVERPAHRAPAPAAPGPAPVPISAATPVPAPAPAPLEPAAHGSGAPVHGGSAADRHVEGASSDRGLSHGKGSGRGHTHTRPAAAHHPIAVFGQVRRPSPADRAQAIHPDPAPTGPAGDRAAPPGADAHPWGDHGQGRGGHHGHG